MATLEIVRNFGNPEHFYVLDMVKTPPEVMGYFSEYFDAEQFVCRSTCDHVPDWNTVHVPLHNEDWDDTPIQVKCRKCGCWGDVGRANIVRPPTWPEPNH